MKLSHLTENRKLDQLIALINIITADNVHKEDFRNHKQSKYGVDYIQKMISEFPQFIYDGPMVRAVTVIGLTPMPVREIMQHPLSKGFQSFSKSTEGMEMWQESLGDVEENQADTILKQIGKGIDVAAVYDHMKTNSRYKKAMYNLERAAEVQEIIAPYYPNIQMIDTVIWDIDEDEDDE